MERCGRMCEVRREEGMRCTVQYSRQGMNVVVPVNPSVQKLMSKLFLTSVRESVPSSNQCKTLFPVMEYDLLHTVTNFLELLLNRPPFEHSSEINDVFCQFLQVCKQHENGIPPFLPERTSDQQEFRIDSVTHHDLQNLKNPPPRSTRHSKIP